MAEMTLSTLVSEGLARRVHGEGAVRIGGIRHDSRAVEPGDLFVAIAGLRHHGSEYARDAIGRGAVAVLAEAPLDLPVPVVVADDALVALSAIARRLYGDPTAALDVVGITGTNGKTTTSYLVEAMLLACGARPAVIGTVSFRGPSGERPPTHTTPMADDLMRLARWAVDTGATHLVLEVSSHALAMHRVDGARFRVAAFTNLTQDHLDYHGDFASYGSAKRRLFDELAPACSVVNVDDAFGAEIARGASGRVLRCSRHAAADAELRALSWTTDREGIVARVGTPAGELALTSPLVGEHNLENLLVALGCGMGLGLDAASALRGLATCRGAPGRLERIDARELAIFVDYAHTPDAIARVLRAVRSLTPGRLWIVFGCGGDRDPGKRPRMGRAAAEGADVAVLTSDNPRGEAPGAIVAAVEAGARDGGMRAAGAAELRAARGCYVVEEDRRAAIRLAIGSAAPGDTILVAGKGHEKVQIVGARKLPFDDCVEAREAVRLREGAPGPGAPDAGATGGRY
jgi:UDP-N-acetylmuramoyl-L-alanyl-D-glutamate--2,6-diaminopimelate ligase